MCWMFWSKLELMSIKQRPRYVNGVGKGATAYVPFRGVTRAILGGFTNRNVSLGGSGGMVSQKNFENHNSTSVNSGLFLIFYRTSKSDIKMFFEHVLHGDDLGGVHRIMQKLQS